MTDSANDIIFEELEGQHGKLGLITLNRPKALNACTTSLCQAMHSQLQKWQDNNSIKAVLITGEGDKAFCAGGDIRSLYENKSYPEKLTEFFKIEYANNLRIAEFTKPYIAWLDGITMGGGIGLSIHGSHRIATERTVVAMHETAIGLFPDIGGGYFLPRFANHIGWYLGLTGARINPRETFYCGIANHLISHKQFDAMKQALLDCDYAKNAFERVTHCLNQFQMNEEQQQQFDNHLEKHLTDIERCFDQQHFIGVIQALKHCNNDWANKILVDFEKFSPTSLLLTFNQFKRGERQTLREEMAMEFTMVQKIIQAHDFYEGVRAMLIDKDKSPQWQPNRLTDVDQQIINDYFDNTLGITL